jgi:hypothetical protein
MLNWWFYLVAPSGAAIYGIDLATADPLPTPDVQGVAWTTKTFAIPTPFGNPPCGQVEFAPNVPYSATVYVEDIAGSPVQLASVTKTAIIVRPNGNKGWSNGQTGTCGNYGIADASVNVNCSNKASAIRCVDVTNVTYNNLQPLSPPTNTWTMQYPQDPGPAPNKIATNTPSVNFPATVDSQAYTLYLNNYATYDYGNGVTVKVQYKLYNKQGSLGYTFAINCNVNLCQLICQMKALRLLAMESCGKVEYPDLLNKITILNLLFSEIIASIMQPLCGNDVPGMVEQWKKISKIDNGNCGCGEGYFGFGNPTGDDSNGGNAPIFVPVSDLNTSPPGGCLKVFSPSDVYDPTGTTILGRAQTVSDMLALINSNILWQAYGIAFDSGSCLVGFFPLYAGVTIPKIVIASDTSSGTWNQGGNSFGATGVLGTNDDNPLNIIINSVLKAIFDGSGLRVLGNLSIDGFSTFTGFIKALNTIQIVDAISGHTAGINVAQLSGDNAYVVPAGGGTFQMRKQVIYSSQFNMKVAGNNPMFTTDAFSSGRFIITDIISVSVNLSGTGINPVYNIGWTASAYSDLVSAGNISSTANAPIQQNLVANYLSVPANTTVTLHITTASTRTLCDVAFHIIGFYENL